MANRPYQPIRFKGTYVSNYVAYPADPRAGFVAQSTFAIFKFDYDHTNVGLIYRYQAGADDSQVLRFSGTYGLTFDPFLQAFHGTIEVHLLDDDGHTRGKQILHAVRVNADQIKFILVHSLGPNESFPLPNFPPHPPNGIVQGVMDRVRNPWQLPSFLRV